MPTPIIAAIFHKADKTDMGFSYWPMGTPARSVTLDSFTQAGITDEVHRHVAELGHHCAVYLRLPRNARKPNGWDRFTRGLQFVEHTGPAPEPTGKRPAPCGISLTKAEALAIQAKQLDHYTPDPCHPVRLHIVARTRTDHLDDDPYTVRDLHYWIPRGADIEHALAQWRAGTLPDVPAEDTATA